MDLTATKVGQVQKPDDGDAFIVIDPKFWDAVLQIDKFSHIIVLWWIDGRDNADDRARLQSTPPKPNAELSGAFACRSPARPTPIGLSVVRLLRVDNQRKRLYLDRIDARDLTYVVDIKPYMPSSDKVDDARVPEWFKDNHAYYTSC
jgi:tRNA-Thr(GGU) m(6)t(6)A37 methyltransferase TsaA